MTDSERFLAVLQRELRGVPGVTSTSIQLSNTGLDFELVGKIDTLVFADGCIPAEEAQIAICWWPQPDVQDRFKFHYSDSAGFDCGWHRQENDHVDGLDHAQWRANSDSPYQYDPITFDHNNAAGLHWEIIGDRLPEQLQSHYGSSNAEESRTS
jgi:hypothetical protein